VALLAYRVAAFPLWAEATWRAKIPPNIRARVRDVDDKFDYGRTDLYDESERD
jgi:hypothetical protein